MVKKRSRRLRKKLYVDEFAVEGFEFSCSVSTAKQSDYDKLLDDFVEFLEGNDLIAGAGAGSSSFDGFIMSDFRYQSATDDDRKLVNKWLSEHPLISNISIGVLVDANS